MTSYNLLADAYASKRLYPTVAPAVLDWSQRRAALLTRLRRLAPDLVCLQEVEARHWPALERELAADSWHGVFAQKRQGRVDGCALLHRTDTTQLLHSEALFYDDGLDAGPGSGHLALIGRLRTPLGILNVVSTHLRWQATTVEPAAHIGFRQARELLRHCAGLTTPTTVICGDFNVGAADPVLRLFPAHGFRDAYAHAPQPTCAPHQNPSRIDFIFASADLEAVGEQLPDIHGASSLPNLDEPSDHLPITAAIIRRASEA